MTALSAWALYGIYLGALVFSLDLLYCLMSPIFTAARQSGLPFWQAFARVARAVNTLSRRQRRFRLEAVLLDRKEVSEDKDRIIAYFAAFPPGTTISLQQLISEAFVTQSFQKIETAAQELLHEGCLQLAPVDLIGSHFCRTPRRYISRTSALTALAARLGIYARAVRGQTPYIPPRTFTIGKGR